MFSLIFSISLIFIVFGFVIFYSYYPVLAGNIIIGLLFTGGWIFSSFVINELLRDNKSLKKNKELRYFLAVLLGIPASPFVLVVLLLGAIKDSLNDFLTWIILIAILIAVFN